MFDLCGAEKSVSIVILPRMAGQNIKNDAHQIEAPFPAAAA